MHIGENVNRIFVQIRENVNENLEMGLRTDVDKMRVLSDGRKKRTGKADVANQELRRK